MGYPGWHEQPTTGKYRTRTQERGKMNTDVIEPRKQSHLLRSVN